MEHGALCSFNRGKAWRHTTLSMHAGAREFRPWIRCSRLSHCQQANVNLQVLRCSHTNMGHFSSVQNTIRILVDCCWNSQMILCGSSADGDRLQSVPQTCISIQKLSKINPLRLCFRNTTESRLKDLGFDITALFSFNWFVLWLVGGRSDRVQPLQLYQENHVEVSDQKPRSFLLLQIHLCLLSPSSLVSAGANPTNIFCNVL